MTLKRLTIIVLAVLALSLVFASVALAANPDRRAILVTTMSGAEEVPPADPDGAGTAKIWLAVNQQSVCWELTAENIDLATAAHIHNGRFDENGPVVVTLSPPDVNGYSSGCEYNVDKGLIRDMIRHPGQYYINVHNATYPGGAIRDQLRKGG